MSHTRVGVSNTRVGLSNTGVSVSNTRVGVSNTLPFAAGDEDKSLVYIFPKKTTLKHRLGTDDALFVDFIGTFHARVFEGVAKSHLRIKAIVCKSPKRRCLSFSLNLPPPTLWRGLSPCLVVSSPEIKWTGPKGNEAEARHKYEVPEEVWWVAEQGRAQPDHPRLCQISSFQQASENR